MQALMSRRLDTFFGAWIRDYSPRCATADTGLDRFSDLSRDVLGKTAAEAERKSRPARAVDATAVEIEIPGRRHRSARTTTARFDLENVVMRP